jgi:hypothetical protein
MDEEDKGSASLLHCVAHLFSTSNRAFHRQEKPEKRLRWREKSLKERRRGGRGGEALRRIHEGSYGGASGLWAAYMDQKVEEEDEKEEGEEEEEERGKHRKCRQKNTATKYVGGET